MQHDWLYRIARALHYQGLNSQDILRTALSMTCTAIEVRQACILTFEDDGRLRDTYLLGVEDEQQQEDWDMLLSEGLIGFVQYEQRIIHIRDISSDLRWPHLPRSSWQDGSAVGVPLMHHATLCGALVLLHPQVDYFQDEVNEFLEEVGGLIGAAYNNARSAELLSTEIIRTQERYESVRRETGESTQLDQLRRDLASMTYHDLRGLLQNIYGSLSGLDRLVSGSKSAQGLLILAMQSTRQMTRMVKGLLDIDRLEQGHAVINKRRTPLHPLLDETMELVRLTAADAGQTVSCEVIEPLPDVQIDSDMITRVLVNLIENGIKHTPEGGHISLRARAKRNIVYLSVSDTGPGIPSNHQSEIFDKYYRIRHVDAPSGVGLGLAFCRLAVEAHGGRIWVENVPNSGAMFTFTLPLEPVPAQA